MVDAVVAVQVCALASQMSQRAPAANVPHRPSTDQSEKHTALIDDGVMPLPSSASAAVKPEEESASNGDPLRHAAISRPEELPALTDTLRPEEHLVDPQVPSLLVQA